MARSLDPSPERIQPRRLRAAAAPADQDLDAGVTIATAARMLGCDASTVYRLIRKGAIEGWRVTADPGRRGEPRVSVASVNAWRNARSLAADRDEGDGPKADARRPARSLTAAHREAVAELKKLRIV